MNENRSPEPTPEELLKLLDLQIQLQRARQRPNLPYRRGMALVVIFLILAAAMVTLFFLQATSGDLSRRSRSDTTPEAMEPLRKY